MPGDVDLIAFLTDQRRSETLKRKRIRRVLVQPDDAEDLILNLAALIRASLDRPQATKPRAPAVHLADPQGVSVCGRNRESLVNDWNEVTCSWCLKALHQPLPVPTYLYGAQVERNAEIVRLVSTGMAQNEVARKMGITRERVRQIVHAAGIDARSLRQEASQAARSAREADWLAKHTRTCIVCGDVYVGRRAYCEDPDCAYIYVTGRRYLSPERYEDQRRAAARIALRQTDLHPGTRAYYRSIVDGTAKPPRSRYAIPDSKIGLALARVEARTGRRLSPGQPKASRRAPKKPSCRAVCQNGAPCTRTVQTEGDLCHIHSGAIRNQS